jgi:type IV pilus assembly protein PilW
MKKTSRGFTLVELMIAVTIALLILLVVSQAYLGALQTQTSQSDTTRLNESARFTFDLLARELRQSGFANTWQRNVTSGVRFCSTAGGSQLLGANDPAAINPAVANFAGATYSIFSPGGASRSDVLRVRYYGEPYSPANPGAGTSALRDCHGQPVAAGQLVEDTMFVSADPNNNNEPTLYCYTSNPVPANATHPGVMPMVSGVESLQLLYGEDTDTDGIVNRYVPWQLVTNADNLLSVKVSVVVRGASTGASVIGGSLAPWNHFSATYPAAANGDTSAVFPAPATNIPSDNRFRKLFSTEISFRNYRWCS